MTAMIVDRPRGPARSRRSDAAVLRVAIVTESYLPSTNGVARSVVQVAEHLESRGHRILVVAPSPPDRCDRAGRVHRTRSVPLPLCREFPVGLPGSLAREAVTSFRPDVVHLASPIVLGAWGAALARKLAVPSVAIYQTDVAGFATQFGLGHGSPAIWRWVRRLHNGCARTLAPSRASVAELRGRGVRDVHRWARGVDLQAFAPRHRTRPWTTEVATVRIGYVGRLSPEKRVDRLVELADLPGTELVIVGDGSDRARLERLLPQARFVGERRGPALSRAFADLDVFVHAGTHETFCQAAQEALASGVPVVAPASGGLLDLVRHGRNGLFFDPSEPGGLRVAVARLVADVGLRTRQGRAARAGVLDRTWRAIGDELIAHYLDVVGVTHDLEQRIAA